MTLRAGLIGLGPHGQRLARVLLSMPTVRLCVVADMRATTLAAVALPGSVRRLRSPGELLGEADLDLVCVATNGPSHAELTISALAAGVRRVMVEKPMACSVEECDRMIEFAAARQARLVVDQSRRHDPTYRFLRERITSGAWGAVRTVWIQRPGAGLGCLGTHSFDLASFLTDRTPTRVTAWVDEPLGSNPRGPQFVDPGGTVVLELGSGVRAVIGQIEDGAGPMSVEIDCTKARVRVDEKAGAVEIVEPEATRGAAGRSPTTYRAVPAPPEVTGRPDILEMMRGLLDELAGDGPLLCDARHGRTAIEVLVASYLSQRRGNVPVPLPLVGDDTKVWLPVT